MRAFAFASLFITSSYALITSAASIKFSAEIDFHFEQFKQRFSRSYTSIDEELKRKEVFSVNMARVDEGNLANGEAVFGVTKYSDWTEEEFKVLLGHKKIPDFTPKRNHVRSPRPPSRWQELASKKEIRFNSTNNALPDYINWADVGIVTPVKNQGQCGSCWAFSAAETIESEWAFQGNPLWEFSPQQIASCTRNCFGCGGGDTIAAYEYIEGVVGLGSDWFAPYTQSMYSECLGKRCTTACSSFNMTDLETYVSLTGPYAVLSNYSYATPACTGVCDEQDTTLLAANVASYGPASVCVNAANWGSYTGGVLSVAGCGGFAYGDLDHCVQLVGYNLTAPTPYWIVRNSWATNWGEDGYIFLEYPGNTCGLADEATFVSISNSN